MLKIINILQNVLVAVFLVVMAISIIVSFA
jgi:hypothetical protein